MRRPGPGAAAGFLLASAALLISIWFGPAPDNDDPAPAERDCGPAAAAVRRVAGARPEWPISFGGDEGFKCRWSRFGLEARNMTEAERARFDGVAYTPFVYVSRPAYSWIGLTAKVEVNQMWYYDGGSSKLCTVYRGLTGWRTAACRTYKMF